MKDFEELTKDLESTHVDLNGVEISDYEIGMRIQCFLNGFELAEKLARDKHKRSIIKIDGELKEYHERRVLNGNNIYGRKCTQATRNKISKALKAKDWKGIPLLPETIEKLRGRIVTKETRDLISKGNKGKKRTEAQIKNMSLAKIGMKYKKHAKAGLN